jgi:DNA primase catalytic subunit
MKFPWKRGNINDTKKEEMQRVFRRVFLSPDGQEVLRLLLNEWSFFDICDTEQKRVLNDYAKVFLHDHLGFSNIQVYSEFFEEKEKNEEK